MGKTNEKLKYFNGVLEKHDSHWHLRSQNIISETKNSLDN